MSVPLTGEPEYRYDGAEAAEARRISVRNQGWFSPDTRAAITAVVVGAIAGAATRSNDARISFSDEAVAYSSKNKPTHFGHSWR